MEMKNRGELLMIVHRVPYPPNKGDKIRSYNLLKFLVSHGWLVHLCTLADNPEDLQYIDELQKLCASVIIEPLNSKLQKIKSIGAPLTGLPMSAQYFYKKKLQKNVDDIFSNHPISAVLCFCSPMAEYIFHANPTIQRACTKRPHLVIDFVDVDSDKWLQYAGRIHAPFRWLYLAESQLLRRYERKVARFFHASLLVSESEAQVFRQTTGIHDCVYSLGNGVDLEYFCPDPENHPAERYGIVFCGAMDYLPNIDAVCWFSREVLPLIRKKLPEACFTIVGGPPSKKVRELASLPGVKLTGRVSDVRPYVRSAALSVAPMRLGRGVQNKVLEAMAMGKAVLTTPQGFEGINATSPDHAVVTRANPLLFAESALSLLSSPHKLSTLGACARALIADRYRWPQQLQLLSKLLSNSL